MSVTRIARVIGRRVWDSRGRPTVEAEVHLAGGAIGRAIAPAGASVGATEAIDLRDGGRRLGGMGVATAVGHVRGPIAARLTGMDAAEQAALDSALVELDGTPDRARLGANATIAVSMAAAHAVAHARQEPLYQYLGGKTVRTLPMPEIQIFGGGAHAARRVDVQDFMVMPVAARSFADALEMTAEVYLAAGRLMRDAGKLAGVADEGGYWPDFAGNEEALEYLVRAIEAAGYRPGDDVGIALDIAAAQFREADGYRLARDGKRLDADGLGALLVDWTLRYPIVSIEDPFDARDPAAWRSLTAEIGGRVQIVADDLVTTQARRIEEAAADRLANAALLKPNQCGTLSETMAALKALRAADWHPIVSARSGETEDVTIVHLAVGWEVGQLKVGSFARSERMAKWNEALRIEDALGGRARFAGPPEPPPES